MGMFSWNCKACGRSIRHAGSVNWKSQWMKHCVILHPVNGKFNGEYDGYGRVRGFGATVEIKGDPCMYHEACYYIAGEPEYNGPSKFASDQGHFVKGDPPGPTRENPFVGKREIKMKGRKQ